MHEAIAYALPLPTPNAEDEEFWSGCRRHELLIQECAACGARRFWGQPMCAACNAFESRGVRASGRGTIWSFTIVHHAFGAVWQESVPYTIVVVQLAEGPRLVSTLVDAEESPVTCDQSVEVLFDDVTPAVTLPRFRRVR